MITVYLTKKKVPGPTIRFRGCTKILDQLVKRSEFFIEQETCDFSVMGYSPIETIKLLKFWQV